MMADRSDDPRRSGPVPAGQEQENLQPGFDRDLRTRLGRGIQSEYGRALIEPLPPRVLQLLSVLDRIAPAGPAHDEAQMAAEDDEPDDGSPPPQAT
jgi:hypothetical protein